MQTKSGLTQQQLIQRDSREIQGEAISQSINLTFAADSLRLAQTQPKFLKN